MQQQILQNFNEHALRIPAETKGMRVFRQPHLCYVDSGLSCDTFNIIHITDGSGLELEEIREALVYFRERKLAYCIWIAKENLTERVQEYCNLLALERKNAEPGMVMDLFLYEPVLREDHTQIVVATDALTIADFAEVIAANWTPADNNVRIYYERTSGNYLAAANRVELLVYYTQGIPVATVEIFATDADTVGLYALATHALYRGKGIGSSLMYYALNRVKAKGYRWVILQASEDGIGIYRKLGFEEHTVYYEYA
jgi:GNAT superfamily N-acetyltransferase